MRISSCVSECVKSRPPIRVTVVLASHLQAAALRTTDFFCKSGTSSAEHQSCSPYVTNSIRRDLTKGGGRYASCRRSIKQNEESSVTRVGATNSTQIEPQRSYEYGNPLKEFLYGQIDFEAGVHQAQLEQTHGVLMGLDEDSLLKPFRARAGFDAPGAELGGWYSSDGYVPGHTFGQWISALSRYYAITGDSQTRAKVDRLVEAFKETVEPEGKFYRKYHFLAYSYDFLACGLADAHQFAHQTNALAVLAASTRVVSQHLSGKAVEMRIDPKRDPDEHCLDHNYVLPENQLIAWQRGGDSAHLQMAQQYMLDEFFDPLARGENILGGLQAYTHVNALSSAAKAYLVLGDEKYLHAAKNGFAYVDAQSYTTGGWGPNEVFLLSSEDAEYKYKLPEFKSLGESIGKTCRHFETSCGAYSHFKLTRYLLRITKDSVYGDSMERVMYNTVLGAKPLRTNGQSFYYSDYSPGARKVYFTGAEGIAPGEWPCCSGTLPQIAADYRISTYFHDENGVFVNLYIPSTLRWKQRSTDVCLRQSGQYPSEGRISLRITAGNSSSFTLRLRIPVWARNPSICVNGKKISSPVIPGTFTALHREWKSGDEIELELPSSLELKPVDSRQPNVVSLVHGPVVLFAIAHDTPMLSRKELLSARRTSSGADEWVVKTDSGSLRFLPWWLITDEQYSTYLTVK